MKKINLLILLLVFILIVGCTSKSPEERYIESLKKAASAEPMTNPKVEPYFLNDEEMNNIGLKSRGKSTSNCNVYCEKITKSSYSYIEGDLGNYIDVEISSYSSKENLDKHYAELYNFYKTPPRNNDFGDKGYSLSNNIVFTKNDYLIQIRYHVTFPESKAIKVAEIVSKKIS